MYKIKPTYLARKVENIQPMPAKGCYGTDDIFIDETTRSLNSK